jgi:hypothetical protein
MYLTFMLLSVVDVREIGWIPLDGQYGEPYEPARGLGVFAVA